MSNRQNFNSEYEFVEAKTLGSVKHWNVLIFNNRQQKYILYDVYTCELDINVTEDNFIELIEDYGECIDMYY